MEVRFNDFGPDVPQKHRYLRGVDFLKHEFDLGLEDAFYLVRHLKNNRSSVCVYAGYAVVDFYISEDQLYVEIDTASGFWHGSNFDLPSAKAILQVVFEGSEEFGSQIPGTTRPWDVY